MPIKWRAPGEKMGTIDLRRLDNDQIVIHFGGKLNSVDAYTFGNSLVSLADTIRAINETINPGQSIEIRLDAVGPGSFRAVIKKVKKGLGGFLSRAPENAFWAILAVWFIDPSFQEGKRIEVFEDRVEISQGGDTIIISRDSFDQLQNTRANPKIERSVRKTFETIERDESIENFGLTPSLDDPEPLVQIPRDVFHKLARGEPTINDSKRRPQHARSIFVTLKPWVDASKHKWSFEWNGVPISAYLTDENFLERIRRHEIRFGNGDALDAKIEYFQDFDDNLGVWVNDTQSFIVSDVYAYVPKDGTRVEFK